MREDIRRSLRGLGARDPVISNGYGFTEMQGPAPECREGSGYHLPTPTEYAIEILDPDTLRPRPDGEPGLVVLTHLTRRGTVLFRYLVGDRSALTWAPCPHCGFAGPRFTLPPYRTGGLVKVKGTLVNLAALHDALTGLPGLEEHQLVLAKADRTDPHSPDLLVVRAAATAAHRTALAAEIARRARAVAEVTVGVEFVPPDAFADPLQDYKFRRVVDERPPGAGLT
jgi:phenylacetate-coenzyme A ligase PaaK-like adenylate-forming protein